MPTNKRLVGLTSIRIGDAISDGMPTSANLQSIQYIVPDSAVINFEPHDSTQLFVEESDDPDIELLTAGLKTIEFATRDISNEVLIWAFGGTSSTTTVWKSSSSAPTTKEVAVEMISKTINSAKVKFEVARASLRASATLRYSKVNSGEIGFALTILTPTNGTTVPIKRTFV